MKLNYCILLLFSLISYTALAQIQTADGEKLTTEEATELLQSAGLSEESILKDFSDEICLCIDSISLSLRDEKYIKQDISNCIDKRVMPYQMGLSILTMADGADQDSMKINIYANPENSNYKDYYYTLERKVMSTCASAKDAVAINNKLAENSISDFSLAISYYDKGIEHFKNKDYEKAIELFQLAVKEDPNFAFAWDDMGLSYRYLGNYKEAIKCYEKSLEIEPTGTVPIQNMAVAYIYLEDFKNARKAYHKLSDENPEKAYGIGKTYLMEGKLEKALDYICESYLIYVELKSPYRTDAESLINLIYQEMTKQGKEKQFNAILDKHKIQY